MKFVVLLFIPFFFLSSAFAEPFKINFQYSEEHMQSVCEAEARSAALTERSLSETERMNSAVDSVAVRSLPESPFSLEIEVYLVSLTRSFEPRSFTYYCHICMNREATPIILSKLPDLEQACTAFVDEET